MRRLLTLVTLVLSAVLLVGCAQEIGTVGYVNGSRISEAEVDAAAAALAKHGYDREDATLFVVESRAAKAIMAAKGLGPDPRTRAAAQQVPEIAAMLDDPATRSLTEGLIDFTGLQAQLEPHGLAVAVADTVKLDPRYGELASVPDASGRQQYVLTGLTGASPGALSSIAPR